MYYLWNIFPHAVSRRPVLHPESTRSRFPSAKADIERLVECTWEDGDKVSPSKAAMQLAKIYIWCKHLEKNGHNSQCTARNHTEGKSFYVVPLSSPLLPTVPGYEMNQTALTLFWIMNNAVT
ncbi:hypothetical protein V1477_016444 [Vespula maculifrons]|uniref:Uncharacterized protein n=1 Tax=Vespula maculifrons TaxID=7453 RepID=A0ABD2BD04_VESMC